MQAYIPQRDAALPLIEQWTALDDQVSHWRVVSGDNIESLYGVSASARIHDPADPGRIFQWLLEEVADAKGNRAQYRYKTDDDAATGGTNRYIEKIRYGNYFPAPQADQAYAYELVFDYGEYALDGLSRPGADPYAPARAWTERPDPFSSFRSGFEIRTRRLCRGVLTFLNFPTELGALPCLNASVRFGYAESPYLSCLSTLLSTGYSRLADGAYEELSVPPMRWGFSAFNPPPAPRFAPLRVLGATGLPGFRRPAPTSPWTCKAPACPASCKATASSRATTSRWAMAATARRWRRRAFPTAATWPIPRWPWSTWTAMASWSCWYRPAAPRASTGMATMAAGAAASRSTPSPPCTAPARPRRWT